MDNQMCIILVGSIMLLLNTTHGCRINCLIKSNTVLDCGDSNTNRKQCIEYHPNHLVGDVAANILLAKFSIVSAPLKLEELTTLKSVKIRHFLGDFSGCKSIHTATFVELNGNPCVRNFAVGILIFECRQ